jgi:hypothetical protein
MEQRWAELASERKMFWEIIGKTYAEYHKHRPHTQERLIELIDSASLPPGVPLKEGQLIIEWPSLHAPSLPADKRYLWEFVTAIYPQAPPQERAQKSLVPADEYKDFDQARRSHSYFWDFWAEEAISKRLLPLKSIFDAFEAQYRLSILLSWLDIALAQVTQDRDQGRKWLYAMGQAWTKHTRKK